jgi:hypothetical protein
MKRALVCMSLTALLVAFPLSHTSHAAGSTGSTGLAAGDFDGDGHDDLAVGVPHEDVVHEATNVGQAGLVNIMYGANDGLRAAGDQIWHQGSPGIAGVPEQNDEFGTSVASGDFDGDGFDDLAVGAAGEDVGASAQSAGAVHIIYGTSDGLSARGDQIWHQDVAGIAGVAELGDQFGLSLATGNIGRGSRADLVIGVPWEDIGSPVMEDAGVAHALYGSGSGLTTEHAQLWHQDTQGVLGEAGETELFAWSLAIADFGRSHHKDLAVGVQRDSSGAINSLLEVGAVNVLYGNATGLRAKGDQRWTQDSPDVKDVAETDDGFGWSLTGANFGRGRRADLAIGSPYEDVGPEGSEVVNAGSVSVLYGSTQGLRAAGNQFFTVSTPGIAGTPELFANFGNSITAGDFGKGRAADLGVGTHREELSFSQQGTAHAIYGSPDGLKPQTSRRWSQESPGIADNPEEEELFGASMATGDFGRSARRDLVIGVPGEDDDAGAATAIYGRKRGLSSAGSQFWHQDSLGIKDQSEANDEFSRGQYN